MPSETMCIYGEMAKNHLYTTDVTKRCAKMCPTLQSWTKMLRKMHLVCLILDYFPPKLGSLKILTPPPLKTMLKGDRNISAPDLTTLTREGWGKGPP